MIRAAVLGILAAGSVCRAQGSGADSLLNDTLFAVADTLAADSSASNAASWLLPLSVIAAAGALFVLLFTTRSK